MILPTACGLGGTTASPSNGPKAVRVGIAGTFTGDLAPVGVGALQGAQMAVDEWNAKGGIDGTKIQVVVGDDGGNSDQALVIANSWIAQFDILGVVGPMLSNLAVSDLKVYQRGLLPMITESATAPKVADSSYAVAHRLVARDDTQQGPLDANFALQTLHAKKVFVLDSGTADSAGLAGQVDKALKAGGATTLRETFASGSKDASPLVAKIKAFNPDLVYFADEGPEAPLLLQALKDQGMPLSANLRYLGSAWQYDTAQFINGASGAAEGAYVSSVTPDITGTDFAKRYQAKYKGGIGPYDAAAYEAMNMILTAIKSSPVQNGVIGREDVLAHLSGETYTDVLGVPLKFDPKGDLVNAGIYFFQVKNGQFQEVKV